MPRSAKLSASTVPEAAPIAPSRRWVLLASLVGTAVEFYDFYVYATAASLVFGPLFFPTTSHSAQLLAAYASFGIAFVARPVGAAVFGHFGDRVGRKSTLVASLLLMGGSTVLIAALPTYAQAGWAAPALLCLLRFGQGFGLGGEWGGAALLAVENAPPGRRAWYGMFPQLGAPVGFIAANGLFLLLGLLLTPEQFERWGWRLPFAASAGLVALGLWIRLKLSETPVFQRLLQAHRPERAPFLALIRGGHLRATLAGTFAAVACFALFYLSTAFALGYGVSTLHYDRRAFLGVQLAAILALAVGIVAAASLADRTSPRRVLMAGCGLTMAVAVALPLAFASGSLIGIGAYLAAALLVMGFVYGPLGAYLPSLFPGEVRYTGASLAFNVGGVLGGGLAPVIAQSLAEHGGLGLVGLYLGAAGALSLLGLIVGPRPPADPDALHDVALGATRSPMPR